MQVASFRPYCHSQHDRSRGRAQQEDMDACQGVQCEFVLGIYNSQRVVRRARRDKCCKRHSTPSGTQSPADKKLSSELEENTEGSSIS
jgi:hypothetical protein